YRRSLRRRVANGSVPLEGEAARPCEPDHLTGRSNSMSVTLRLINGVDPPRMHACSALARIVGEAFIVSEAKQRHRTRRRADEVDIHVGSRIRQRRLLIGWSQSQLGSELDLTFQQVQKYERGANRIGAGLLYRISRILDVPVSYFYEGLPGIAETTISLNTE